MIDNKHASILDKDPVFDNEKMIDKLYENYLLNEPTLKASSNKTK